MAFFTVGEGFIEVVASGRPPALWGIAFSTPDLDACVAAVREAGGPIGDPKQAVQGGRIASVWKGHVDWGIAVMECAPLTMDRRRFLRNATLGLGAVAVGPALSRLFGGTTAEAEASHPFLGGSMLDAPAREAGIDHVVVLMMENRSFDHFLGWLASDETFLENGRSRYGELFRVHGDAGQELPRA